MVEYYTPEEVPESLKWFYDLSFDENSEFFTWVDRRVVREHEKLISASVDFNSAKRTEERLREMIRAKNKKIQELRAELKEIKAEAAKEEKKGIIERIKAKL